MKKLTTIFAVLAACALQAQTVTLKLQLEEGETFVMQIQQNMEVTQSAMGQEVKIKTAVQVTNLYTVVGQQEDGQWILEGQFQEINVQIDNLMGGKVTFGTDVKLKDDTSQAVRALVNKPYTVLVTEKGVVTAVNGMDDIFTEMDTELASLSRNRKKAAIEQVKAAFNEKTSKKFVEGCFVKDPGRELKPGHVWMVRDTTAENGIEMFADNQYRLEGFDEQAIQVSIMTIMQNNPNNKPVINNGVEMTTSLYGTMKGKVMLDAQTGWVVEGEFSADISGSATVYMRGESMDIPMTIKSRNTVKRL